MGLQSAFRTEATTPTRCCSSSLSQPCLLSLSPIKLPSINNSWPQCKIHPSELSQDKLLTPSIDSTNTVAGATSTTTLDEVKVLQSMRSMVFAKLWPMDTNAP